MCGGGFPINQEKAVRMCIEGSLKGKKICEAIKYFKGGEVT